MCPQPRAGSRFQASAFPGSAHVLTRKPPGEYVDPLDLRPVDDIALALTDEGVPVGKIGKVTYIDGDSCIRVMGLNGDGYALATAWLRVGGVEQGPRPEVGGRVIALSVHLPEDFDAPGMVGTVDFVGYDAIDRLGPLVVFPDPHGIEQRTRVTEWALLPAEADGIDEATAGRTVGSLNAGDVGRWIEIDPWPGTLLRVTGRLTEAPGEVRTVDGRRLLELHLHHPTHGRLGHLWIPETPCRVSDGPGETT